MKQTTIHQIALCLLILAGITACSEQEESTNTSVASKDADAPLSIYVVNYPLRYFAERIGGPQVEVTLPVPEVVDPAFWEPDAAQITAYQRADLILLNGASYAKWAQHVSLPLSRMVDTSAAFANRYIPTEGQANHSHGAAGEHQHGDVAFTTWLDPLQAVAQAEAIRDSLIRLHPNKAADFQERFAALAEELQELDKELAMIFGTGRSKTLIFSHPVYQYLIRRYGIDGHAAHWEPDDEPTTKQWQELAQLLTRHPARWMVWESAPDLTTVAELNKRGLNSVVFDPCGNAPEEGDYLSVMHDNLRRLSEAQPLFW